MNDVITRKLESALSVVIERDDSNYLLVVKHIELISQLQKNGNTLEMIYQYVKDDIGIAFTTFVQYVAKAKKNERKSKRTKSDVDVVHVVKAEKAPVVAKPDVVSIHKNNNETKPTVKEVLSNTTFNSSNRSSKFTPIDDDISNL